MYTDTPQRQGQVKIDRAAAAEEAAVARALALRQHLIAQGILTAGDGGGARVTMPGGRQMFRPFLDGERLARTKAWLVKKGVITPRERQLSQGVH